MGTARSVEVVEKCDKDVKQLELRLEDLETTEAAAEPEPPATASVKQYVRRRPARRPLPAELPRETETIAGRASSWIARRWPIGWAERAGRYSLWWKR